MHKLEVFVVVLTANSIREGIKIHSIQFLICHINTKTETCLCFQPEDRNVLDLCDFRNCGRFRLLVQQRRLSVPAGSENPIECWDLLQEAFGMF